MTLRFCDLQGYKDDKLYFVAVPLSIRSFMRETAGRIARQEQKKAEVSGQGQAVATTGGTRACVDDVMTTVCPA